MIYHVYARLGRDGKWYGHAEMPGSQVALLQDNGEDNPPFSLELLYMPRHRKLEKCLLATTKLVLQQPDCTEVKIIVR